MTILLSFFLVLCVAEHSSAAEEEPIPGRQIQRTMRLLESSTPENPNRVRILVYGQSITGSGYLSSHLGKELKKRYPHAEILLENRSLGGHGVPLLTRTAEHDLFPFYPDLLIFHAYDGDDNGALEKLFRDILQNTSSEILTWTDHFDVLYSVNREKDFVRKREIQDRHNRYRLHLNDCRRRMARMLGIELVEVQKAWQKWLKDHPGDGKTLPEYQLLRDNIHLNPEGEKLLYREVLKHFVRIPGADAEADEKVQIYSPGDLRQNGDWLELPFEGSRVELKAGNPGGKLEVLIDGQKPSLSPAAHYVSRPRLSGDRWNVPPIKQVLASPDASSGETWTMLLNGFNHAEKSFRFSLSGSLTGKDGEGSTADSVFVSRSGKIRFRISDFDRSRILLYAKRNKDRPLQITWEVRTISNDTFVPQKAKEQIIVFQTRNTGKHLLKIRNSGVDLKEIRISGKRIPNNHSLSAMLFCVPQAPCATFTEGEALLFRMQDDVSGKYRLVDVRGRVLRNVPFRGKQLEIASLPCGAYRLFFEIPGKRVFGSRPFLIVPDRKGRAMNPKSPYGMVRGNGLTPQGIMDRVNRGNPGYRKSANRDRAALFARIGVSAVREHYDLIWTHRKSPESFDWQQMPAAIEDLKKYGIRFVGMGSGTPPWARSNQSKRLFCSGRRIYGTDSLPDDAFYSYRRCKGIAEKVGGSVFGFEYWNEPFNFPDPAWDFIACAKAAYLGFKAGNPKMNVLSSSYYYHAHPQMFELFLKSGGGYYYDILNYHDYSPPASVQEHVLKLRALLKRYGLNEWSALFNTENNGAFLAGKIPYGASFSRNFTDYSHSQQLIEAETIVKSQLAHQAMGVAGVFTFRAAWSPKGFGYLCLLYPDTTAHLFALPFAVMTANLDQAVFLGTAELGKNFRGLLYRQPDGTETLACWKISPVDTQTARVESPFQDDWLEGNLDLTASDGTYSCQNSFGERSLLRAKNGVLRVPVNRFPTYLHGLRNRKIARMAYPEPVYGAPEAPFEKRIVLRPLLHPRDFRVAGLTSTTAILLAEKGAMDLEIYNFSSEHLTGNILAQGFEVSGLNETIQIGPMEKQVLKNLRISPVEKTGIHQKDLVLMAVFSGKRSSPAIVPISYSGKWKEFPLRKLSASMFLIHGKNVKQADVSDAENGVIRFRVQFSAFPEKGANWVNAIYRLKQPVESLKNAVGIRYEIRLTGKSGIVGSETERNFETATLGLLKSSSADQTIYRESVWIPTRIPNDVWQEVYLPFPVATASWKENASKYQAVAFGLNPEFLSLEFELRNIRIVYAD